jgi:hypothetical protein
MEDLITVISFPGSYEAYIAKNLLESEGIEVFLADELTSQVYINTGAIGGIKLQVSTVDYDKACSILNEHGYFRQRGKKEGSFWKKLDKTTGRLPFIGKTPLEIRFVVICAVIILLVILPVLIFLLNKQIFPA